MMLLLMPPFKINGAKYLASQQGKVFMTSSSVMWPQSQLDDCRGVDVYVNRKLWMKLRRSN